MFIRVTLVLFLCLVSGCAGAATVYVDVNASGTLHDGASWATAFQSINNALSSLPYGGDVWVKTGTYKEQLAIATYFNLYGGFLGYETTTAQRIPGAFPTVIDAERKNTAINIAQNVHCTIDGFTIENGDGATGGGICCGTTTTAKIEHCLIQDCAATGEGGGVYFGDYAMGDLTNCTVMGCKAAQGAGVVVEYHAGTTLNSDLIAYNRASVSGGGLYCPFHSDGVMQNCTLAYNVADVNGGGAYTYYGGAPSFSHCIIAFNSAPAGGGFYGDGSSSQTTVDYSDTYSNQGGDWGGAIVPTSPYDYGNISVDPRFSCRSAMSLSSALLRPAAEWGHFR